MRDCRPRPRASAYWWPKVKGKVRVRCELGWLSVETEARDEQKQNSARIWI